MFTAIKSDDLKTNILDGYYPRVMKTNILDGYYPRVMKTNILDGYYPRVMKTNILDGYYPRVTKTRVQEALKSLNRPHPPSSFFLGSSVFLNFL